MTRTLLLLSMITLAVGSVTAQTGDKAEIERLRAELARLKAENALPKIRPEDIEKLVSEADALYEQGKYREAKAKMLRAYAAFERLPVKDKATRVGYLRVLCNISDQLQENDKTIEYATEVSIHAGDDDDRALPTTSSAWPTTTRATTTRPSGTTKSPWR